MTTFFSTSEEEEVTEDDPFAIGDVVEYYSRNTKDWRVTQIISRNPDGTYILGCKKGALASNIRSWRPLFAPGDRVEYQHRQRGWVLTHVILVNKDGTYDLGMMNNVPSNKVRALSNVSGSESSSPDVAVQPRTQAVSHSDTCSPARTLFDDLLQRDADDRLPTFGASGDDEPSEDDPQEQWEELGPALTNRGVSFARSSVERDDVVAQKTSAVLVLQAMQRGRKARQETEARRNAVIQETSAAVLLQSIQRGRKARKEAAERRGAVVEETSSALRLQSEMAMPGENEDDDMDSRLQSEIAMSAEIEDGARRNAVVQETSAALVLQAMQRGRKARKEAAARRGAVVQETSAAILLQSIQRGRKARKEAAERRGAVVQETSSALRLQSEMAISGANQDDSQNLDDVHLRRLQKQALANMENALTELSLDRHLRELHQDKVAEAMAKHRNAARHASHMKTVIHEWRVICWASRASKVLDAGALDGRLDVELSRIELVRATKAHSTLRSVAAEIASSLETMLVCADEPFTLAKREIIEEEAETRRKLIQEEALREHALREEHSRETKPNRSNTDQDQPLHEEQSELSQEMESDRSNLTRGKEAHNTFLLDVEESIENQVIRQTVRRVLSMVYSAVQKAELAAQSKAKDARATQYETPSRQTIQHAPCTISDSDPKGEAAIGVQANRTQKGVRFVGFVDTEAKTTSDKTVNRRTAQHVLGTFYGFDQIHFRWKQKSEQAKLVQARRANKAEAEEKSERILNRQAARHVLAAIYCFDQKAELAKFAKANQAHKGVRLADVDVRRNPEQILNRQTAWHVLSIMYALVAQRLLVHQDQNAQHQDARRNAEVQETSAAIRLQSLQRGRKARKEAARRRDAVVQETLSVLRVQSEMGPPAEREGGSGLRGVIRSHLIYSHHDSDSDSDDDIHHVTLTLLARQSSMHAARLALASAFQDGRLDMFVSLCESPDLPSPNFQPPNLSRKSLGASLEQIRSVSAARAGSTAGVYVDSVAVQKLKPHIPWFTQALVQRLQSLVEIAPETFDRAIEPLAAIAVATSTPACSDADARATRAEALAMEKGRISTSVQAIATGIMSRRRSVGRKSQDDDDKSLAAPMQGLENLFDFNRDSPEGVLELQDEPPRRRSVNYLEASPSTTFDSPALAGSFSSPSGWVDSPEISNKQRSGQLESPDGSTESPGFGTKEQRRFGSLFEESPSGDVHGTLSADEIDSLSSPLQEAEPVSRDSPESPDFGIKDARRVEVFLDALSSPKAESPGFGARNETRVESLPDDDDELTSRATVRVDKGNFVFSPKLRQEGQLRDIFRRCGIGPDGCIIKRELVQVLAEDQDAAEFFGFSKTTWGEDNISNTIAMGTLDTAESRRLTWEEFEILHAKLSSEYDTDMESPSSLEGVSPGRDELNINMFDLKDSSARNMDRTSEYAGVGEANIDRDIADRTLKIACVDEISSKDFKAYSHDLAASFSGEDETVMQQILSFMLEQGMILEEYSTARTSLPQFETSASKNTSNDKTEIVIMRRVGFFQISYKCSVTMLKASKLLARARSIAISSRDDVNEDDYEPYIEAIAESLSRGFESIQQQIFKFMCRGFSLLDESGVESIFPAFDISAGDRTEYLLVDMNIVARENQFQISYQGRVEVDEEELAQNRLLEELEKQYKDDLENQFKQKLEQQYKAEQNPFLDDVDMLDQCNLPGFGTTSDDLAEPQISESLKCPRSADHHVDPSNKFTLADWLTEATNADALKEDCSSCSSLDSPDVVQHMPSRSQEDQLLDCFEACDSEDREKVSIHDLVRVLRRNQAAAELFGIALSTGQHMSSDTSVLLRTVETACDSILTWDDVCYLYLTGFSFVRAACRTSDRDAVLLESHRIPSFSETTLEDLHAHALTFQRAAALEQESGKPFPALATVGEEPIDEGTWRQYRPEWMEMFDKARGGELCLNQKGFHYATSRICTDLSEAQLSALWQGFVDKRGYATMNASDFCNITTVASVGEHAIARYIGVSLTSFVQLQVKSEQSSMEDKIHFRFENLRSGTLSSRTQDVLLDQFRDHGVAETWMQKLQVQLGDDRTLCVSGPILAVAELRKKIANKSIVVMGWEASVLEDEIDDGTEDGIDLSEARPACDDCVIADLEREARRARLRKIAASLLAAGGRLVSVFNRSGANGNGRLSGKQKLVEACTARHDIAAFFGLRNVDDLSSSRRQRLPSEAVAEAYFQPLHVDAAGRTTWTEFEDFYCAKVEEEKAADEAERRAKLKVIASRGRRRGTYIGEADESRTAQNRESGRRAMLEELEAWKIGRSRGRRHATALLIAGLRNGELQRLCDEMNTVSDAESSIDDEVHPTGWASKKNRQRPPRPSTHLDPRKPPPSWSDPRRSAAETNSAVASRRAGQRAAESDDSDDGEKAAEEWMRKRIKVMRQQEDQGRGVGMDDDYGDESWETAAEDWMKRRIELMRQQENRPVDASDDDDGEKAAEDWMMSRIKVMRQQKQQTGKAIDDDDGEGAAEDWMRKRIGVMRKQKKQKKQMEQMVDASEDDEGERVAEDWMRNRIEAMRQKNKLTTEGASDEEDGEKAAKDWMKRRIQLLRQHEEGTASAESLSDDGNRHEDHEAMKLGLNRFAYAYELRETAAVRRIQGLVRARWQAAADAKAKDASVVRLQAAMRGRMARNEADAERKRKQAEIEARESSARRLQAAVRGRFARREFAERQAIKEAEMQALRERQQASAVRIQSLQRRKMAKDEAARRRAEQEWELQEARRRDAEREFQIREFSATRIQSAHRGKIAQREAARRRAMKEEEQSAKDAAAVRLQSAHRGKMAQREAARRRVAKEEEQAERDAAAIRLQAAYRGRRGKMEAARRRTAKENEQKAKDAAAIRLQSAQRGKVAQKEAARRRAAKEEQQKTKDAAAMRIQSAHRGKMAEIEVAWRRTDKETEELNANALRLQAVQRGRMGRKEAEVRRREKERLGLESKQNYHYAPSSTNTSRTFSPFADSPLGSELRTPSTQSPKKRVPPYGSDGGMRDSRTTAASSATKGRSRTPSFTDDASSVAALGEAHRPHRQQQRSPRHRSPQQRSVSPSVMSDATRSEGTRSIMSDSRVSQSTVMDDTDDDNDAEQAAEGWMRTQIEEMRQQKNTYFPFPAPNKDDEAEEAERAANEWMYKRIELLRQRQAQNVAATRIQAAHRGRQDRKWIAGTFLQQEERSEDDERRPAQPRGRMSHVVDDCVASFHELRSAIAKSSSRRSSPKSTSRRSSPKSSSRRSSPRAKASPSPSRSSFSRSRSSSPSWSRSPARRRTEARAEDRKKVKEMTQEIMRSADRIATNGQLPITELIAFLGGRTGRYKHFLDWLLSDFKRHDLSHDGVLNYGELEAAVAEYLDVEWTKPASANKIKNLRKETESRLQKQKLQGLKLSPRRKVLNTELCNALLAEVKTSNTGSDGSHKALAAGVLYGLTYKPHSKTLAAAYKDAKNSGRLERGRDGRLLQPDKKLMGQRWDAASRSFYGSRDNSRRFSVSTAESSEVLFDSDRRSPPSNKTYFLSSSSEDEEEEKKSDEDDEDDDEVRRLAGAGKKVAYIGSPELLDNLDVFEQLRALTQLLVRNGHEVIVGVPNAALAHGTGAIVEELADADADNFDVVLVAPCGDDERREAEKFAKSAKLIHFVADEGFGNPSEQQFEDTRIGGDISSMNVDEVASRVQAICDAIDAICDAMDDEERYEEEQETLRQKQAESAAKIKAKWQGERLEEEEDALRQKIQARWRGERPEEVDEAPHQKQEEEEKLRQKQAEAAAKIQARWQGDRPDEEEALRQKQAEAAAKIKARWQGDRSEEEDETPQQKQKEEEGLRQKQAEAAAKVQARWQADRLEDGEALRQKQAEAAARIQARWQGHQLEKNQKALRQKQPEEDSLRKRQAEEATSKIQARWRAHQLEKEEGLRQKQAEATAKIQARWRTQQLEERQAEATAQIQARWRAQQLQIKQAEASAKIQGTWRAHAEHRRLVEQQQAAVTAKIEARWKAQRLAEQQADAVAKIQGKYRAQRKLQDQDSADGRSDDSDHASSAESITVRHYRSVHSFIDGPVRRTPTEQTGEENALVRRARTSGALRPTEKGGDHAPVRRSRTSGTMKPTDKVEDDVFVRQKSTSRSQRSTDKAASRKTIGYVGSPGLLKNAKIAASLASLIEKLVSRGLAVTVGEPNKQLAVGTGAMVTDMSVADARMFDVILVAPGGNGAMSEAKKFSQYATIIYFVDLADELMGKPDWLTSMAGSKETNDLTSMNADEVASKVLAAISATTEATVKEAFAQTEQVESQLDLQSDAPARNEEVRRRPSDRSRRRAWVVPTASESKAERMVTEDTHLAAQLLARRLIRAVYVYCSIAEAQPAVDAAMQFSQRSVPANAMEDIDREREQRRAAERELEQLRATVAHDLVEGISGLRKTAFEALMQATASGELNAVVQEMQDPDAAPATTSSLAHVGKAAQEEKVAMEDSVAQRIAQRRRLRELREVVRRLLTEQVDEQEAKLGTINLRADEEVEEMGWLCASGSELADRVIVQEVFPDGWAWRHGLKADDLLTSIAGMSPPQDVQELHTILSQRPLHLVFAREVGFVIEPDEVEEVRRAVTAARSLINRLDEFVKEPVCDEGSGIAVPPHSTVAAAASLSEEEIAQAREVFVTINSSRSGYISAKELESVLQALGEERDSWEVRAMIDAGDIQGANGIGYADFMALFVSKFTEDAPRTTESRQHVSVKSKKSRTQERTPSPPLEQEVTYVLASDVSVSARSISLRTRGRAGDAINFRQGEALRLNADTATEEVNRVVASHQDADSTITQVELAEEIRCGHLAGAIVLPLREGDVVAGQTPSSDILVVRVWGGVAIPILDTGFEGVGNKTNLYVQVNLGKERPCQTPPMPSCLDPTWTKDNEFSFRLREERGEDILKLEVFDHREGLVDSLGFATFDVRRDFTVGQRHMIRAALVSRDEYGVEELQLRPPPGNPAQLVFDVLIVRPVPPRPELAAPEQPRPRIDPLPARNAKSSPRRLSDVMQDVAADAAEEERRLEEAEMSRRHALDQVWGDALKRAKEAGAMKVQQKKMQADDDRAEAEASRQAAIGEREAAARELLAAQEARTKAQREINSAGAEADAARRDAEAARVVAAEAQARAEETMQRSAAQVHRAQQQSAAARGAAWRVNVASGLAVAARAEEERAATVAANETRAEAEAMQKQAEVIHSQLIAQQAASEEARIRAAIEVRELQDGLEEARRRYAADLRQMHVAAEEELRSAEADARHRQAMAKKSQDEELRKVQKAQDRLKAAKELLAREEAVAMAKAEEAATKADKQRKAAEDEAAAAMEKAKRAKHEAKAIMDAAANGQRLAEKELDAAKVEAEMKLRAAERDAQQKRATAAWHRAQKNAQAEERARRTAAKRKEEEEILGKLREDEAAAEERRRIAMEEAAAAVEMAERTRTRVASEVEAAQAASAEALRRMTEEAEDARRRAEESVAEADQYSKQKKAATMWKAAETQRRFAAEEHKVAADAADKRSRILAEAEAEAERLKDEAEEARRAAKLLEDEKLKSAEQIDLELRHRKVMERWREAQELQKRAKEETEAASKLAELAKKQAEIEALTARAAAEEARQRQAFNEQELQRRLAEEAKTREAADAAKAAEERKAKAEKDAEAAAAMLQVSIQELEAEANAAREAAAKAKRAAQEADAEMASTIEQVAQQVAEERQRRAKEKMVTAMKLLDFRRREAEREAESHRLAEEQAKNREQWATEAARSEAERREEEAKIWRARAATQAAEERRKEAEREAAAAQKKSEEAEEEFERQEEATRLAEEEARRLAAKRDEEMKRVAQQSKEQMAAWKVKVDEADAAAFDAESRRRKAEEDARVAAKRFEYTMALLRTAAGAAEEKRKNVTAAAEELADSSSKVGPDSDDERQQDRRESLDMKVGVRQKIAQLEATSTVSRHPKEQAKSETKIKKGGKDEKRTSKSKAVPDDGDLRREPKKKPKEGGKVHTRMNVGGMPIRF